MQRSVKETGQDKTTMPGDISFTAKMSCLEPMTYCIAAYCADALPTELLVYFPKPLIVTDIHIYFSKPMRLLEISKPLRMFFKY